jgi:hypothetical protein
MTLFRTAWRGGIYPNMMVPDSAGFVSTPHAPQSEAEQAYAQAEAARHQDDDPHLRSCKAVMSYHIQATDGDIGHIQALLVDEETWAIRYMIVDTSNWWLGHKVLIAPQWIRNGNWHDATVSVDLTQQAVKAAAAYDSTAALNREQETGIYEHYRRPAYWVGEAKGPKPGD